MVLEQSVCPSPSRLSALPFGHCYAFTVTLLRLTRAVVRCCAHTCARRMQWGIVSAGCWSSFAAAHSDLFGERPQLSARIHARDGMWINLTSFLGLFSIPLMTRFGGLQSANFASVVLGLASMAVCLSLPETLKVRKRIFCDAILYSK